MGFKGSRKSTPYAAQVAAEQAARRAGEFGMRKVDVIVRGSGSGRETAIRTLQTMGMEVTGIKDITPIPHNGCASRSVGGPLVMARYTGAGCKLCRRERTKLLDESKAKCVDRKPYPPGEHGRGRIRETQYLIQLREKQKLRRIYGVLEKQFRNYYKEANRARASPARTCCDPREPSRQRRVPRRARRVPGPGPSVGLPRPLPGQRQAGRCSVVSGPPG